MTRPISRLLVSVACAACAFAFLAATPCRAQPVTVSAAVSLKEALTDVGTQYEKDTGQPVQLNFGATGHLLAQMREGAAIDLFIAASDAQMDQAEKMALVDPATRRPIAGNALVLIVPKDAKSSLRGFADLSNDTLKRLAIGQPRTVPAGDYAMQVLRKLGIESSLNERLVFGSNVRQVLDYVERGEVDAGIVYATDVRQSGDKVRVVATADAAWHAPIRYVGAVVKATARRDDAERFKKYLASDSARAAMAKHGFVQPAAATTAPAK